MFGSARFGQQVSLGVLWSSGAFVATYPASSELLAATGVDIRADSSLLLSGAFAVALLLTADSTQMNFMRSNRNGIKTGLPG